MARVISMKSHLDCIEDQFNMSGLSSGLYGEYANDVAIAFALDLLCKLRDEGVHNMTDLEIHNTLKDKSNVKQIDDWA